MYPTFYHLALDLFGIDFAPFMYVKSYGMMVGIGFIVGSILLTLELKRKERIGQILPTKKDKKDIKDDRVTRIGRRL